MTSVLTECFSGEHLLECQVGLKLVNAKIRPVIYGHKFDRKFDDDTVRKWRPTGIK